MQDLLAQLLWRNVEVDEAADRLRKSLPGFAEARREFQVLEEQVRAIVGYDLYDRYAVRLAEYNDFQIRAYYALGLGLREAMAQALEG